MLNLEDELGMNNAIVVAHPDDLALLFGGLPIRFKYRKWTAICCSIPHNDQFRAYRFFESCFRLNVKPILIPLEEPATDILHLEWLDLKEYDSVITHGIEEEHSHHQQVSQVVSKLCKPIKLDKVGNCEIHLTVQEANKKIQALKAFDYNIDYKGNEITKWESLIIRHCQESGNDIMVERYKI